MAYELKKFIMLEEDLSTVRYFMIGINTDTDAFSGLVYGYCGGGTYADEYIINWKSLEEIDEDMMDCDGDEKEAALEEVHSGIVEEIYAVIDTLFDYDNANCLYTIKKSAKVEFDADNTYGEFKNPIDFWNTYFTDK